MTDVVQSHNLKAQSVWNSPGGRYDDISRSIADAIEHAVERLQPKPGERILDLATGTGWGSRILAQRFAGVQLTGADIADQMLEYARGRNSIVRKELFAHRRELWLWTSWGFALSAVNVDEHRVKGDLARFKEFIESRGHESGARRGDVQA